MSTFKQIPQTSSRSAAIRDRLSQDFEDRGGRFSRHRTRQSQQQMYRSTGHGMYKHFYLFYF